MRTASYIWLRGFCFGALVMLLVVMFLLGGCKKEEGEQWNYPFKRVYAIYKGR